MSSVKLKLLAAKQRVDVEIVQAQSGVGGEACTIDDLILMSLGASALSFNGNQPRMIRVDFGEGKGLEFELPICREIAGSWQVHLTEIYALVTSLSVDDEVLAVRKVMDAEGWVFGKHTLKTPSWMSPHAELTYMELHGHGFDWIAPPI
jgi:hypothetical protein